MVVFGIIQINAEGARSRKAGRSIAQRKSSPAGQPYRTSNYLWMERRKAHLLFPIITHNTKQIITHNIMIQNLRHIHAESLMLSHMHMM